MTEFNQAIVFKVTNLAYSAYNSRQEVVVAALWAPKLQPDLIINLDGANDIIHRLRMNEPYTFYLNDAYELSLTKPLLAPFAEILRHSQLFHGLQRLKARMMLKMANAYYDCIPVYLSAVHSMNMLGCDRSLPRCLCC